jgi:multidrug efflux pump subunit AcrA (membrane-fusion protein)
MLPVPEQVQLHFQELVRLASSEAEAEQFFVRLLQSMMTIIPDVAAGAIWIVQSPGAPPQLFCQSKLNAAWIDKQSPETQRHEALILRVIATGKPCVLPAGADGASPSVANSFADHLLLVPVVRDQRALGVIELVIFAHAALEQQQDNLKILARFAGLVGQWLATRSMKHVQRRGDFLSQIDRFAKEIHSSIDLRETCYAIANETRLFLKCDRVGVLTARDRRCKLVAVSGQATIDSRASLVVALTELVQAVLISGETLLYEGQPLDLPPQVEELLENYLDESHAKGLLIVPLGTVVDDEPSQTGFLTGRLPVQNSTRLGALAIEQFEGEQAIADISKECDALLDHIRLALGNAVDHHNVPLLPLMNLMGRSRALVSSRNLPKTLWMGALLLLFGTALCFWPAELRIRAGGSLQPIERRDVFVDVPGTVKQVLVSHGDRVEVGDILAELENTDLEVQLAEVVGQLQTTEQQALAAEKKMVDDAELDTIEKHQLASDRLTLNRRIDSLKQQYRLLDAQHKQLTVRSTAAGSVITWDVGERLLNKPLSKGEILMSVADLEGPWELDLFMPERRIGHVTQAQQELKKPLDVQFILRTNPGETKLGTIKEIHASAELQEVEGLGVRIKVDFDEQNIANLYPGAAVAAEVNCGRHALGYVWFHEIFEWVYTHIFF